MHSYGFKQYNSLFLEISYSHSHIDKVYNYVANQEKHHQKESFKEEYVKHLERFEVPYDERYLFEDLT